MKRIILIRHAKSSWDQNLKDLERPLSRRGFEDATLLANAFKSYDFYPDAIYSSPANRAVSTCAIFMENLDLPKKLLTIEKQLYDFGGNKVEQFIKSLNDDLDKIMIFGHNHAFTSLANSFGDVYIDNLPTSGVVMIDFDVDHWQEITSGKTQLILSPKNLK